METINESAEKNKIDYGLVSIVMPNYNAENFIEASVKSVLNQTYGNWELLFVDDCSSDNSLNIVKSFADDRIKIYSTPKNLGAAAARNLAIENAAGKYIAFLDSDDLWMPDKLQKQISFMEKNDFPFSFTDYKVVTKNGGKTVLYRSPKDFCDYGDVLKHNLIGCLTAVYNAEKLGKNFMPEQAVKREDFACWLAILKKGVKVHCLHEYLAKYIIHSDSVSACKSKMIKYQWNVYRNVEKLSFFKSVYYMLNWAISGIFKYH